MILGQGNLSIIGSTGSLGSKVFESALSMNRRITALAGGENIKELLDQTRKARPLFVSVSREEKAEELERALLDHFPREDFPEIGFGREGIKRAAEFGDYLAVTTNGLVGVCECENALKRGAVLLLGSKEIAVVAGVVLRHAATAGGGDIIPLDSELTAVVQLLKGRDFRDLDRVVLCASGGPFLGKTKEELCSVTVAEALNHPVWSMGNKVSIDSATLFNKAMEIMVAERLLGIPTCKLGVVIHPQSRVHAFVQMLDGALLFQSAPADMSWAAGYALKNTKEKERLIQQADLRSGVDDFFIGILRDFKEMTFLPVKKGDYVSLDLGWRSLKKGGGFPALLAGADQVLVGAFLRDRISFCDILRGLEAVFSKATGSEHLPEESTDLDAMITAWEEGERIAEDWIAKVSVG